MAVETQTLEQAQHDLKTVVRIFGDRCNGDSVLTEREATFLVKAAVNGANMLEDWVRDRRAAEPPAEKPT